MVLNKLSVFIFIHSLMLTAQSGEPISNLWQPVGLSGGGAIFTPAISPVDSKLMMLNCDMSAAYISQDGGLNWKMIHYSQLRASTQCRPAFHPSVAEIVYAANGYAGLKISRDCGERWENIGNLPGDLRGEIAIDPGNPKLMLTGVADNVWRSLDGGQKWKQCVGLHGTAVSFHFDQSSPAAQRVCFTATDEGIWRSDDGGSTWIEKSAGLPWRQVRSFTGGSNARDKRIALYCAIPSRNEKGRFSGGVYRSTDRGETWESAMGSGINTETKAADEWSMGNIAEYHHVVTTNIKPLTVYAFNANTGVYPPHHTAVYRSEDGGKSWHPTFYPDPRFKEFNIDHDYTTATVHQFYQDVPTGVAIDAVQPDHLMQLDGGRCYITSNGGKSWTCGHTRSSIAQKAANDASSWLCNGLVVTTTWNYYIDPFEPRRHYIPYTDIGFSHSLDSGKSWVWWSLEGRAPWQNTCYEIAFDPQTPGKIWGAFSNVHDIPNDNIISGRHKASGPGGICVSTDFASTWKISNQGLPVAPALSVVLDPKSPKGARTLYASVFGHGVFKSTDDGKSWSKKSQGLGTAGNMRTCRLQLHADGTLFVVITALRKGKVFVADGVGLYRSRNAGETWELINRSHPLLWPKDFTVDPKDSQIIYLGACDANMKEEGGLYGTEDGGLSWKRLARQGSEHFGAYLHPKRPGWIYMTLCENAPGSGLWLSCDKGLTWTPFKGLPFGNIQRVTFDPADDATIYVSTFGGSIWRGPAKE